MAHSLCSGAHFATFDERGEIGNEVIPPESHGAAKHRSPRFGSQLLETHRLREPRMFHEAIDGALAIFFREVRQVVSGPDSVLVYHANRQALLIDELLRYDLTNDVHRTVPAGSILQIVCRADIAQRDIAVLVVSRNTVPL